MKKIYVIDFWQDNGRVQEVRVRLPQGQTFQGEATFWLTWDDWADVVASGQVEIEVSDHLRKTFGVVEESAE